MSSAAPDAAVAVVSDAAAAIDSPAPARAVSSISVRPAKPDDVPRILELITELAVFERAPTEVTNTAAQLLQDGWGPQPRFIAFMAHLDSDPSAAAVGFALCYFSYSTWKGTCLYLEDLYVQQSCRGSGVGMALIHRCVAEAQSRGCKRVQWQALDWNQPALQFYEKIGAAEMREWISLRLDATAMEAFLAKHKPVYNSVQ